MVPPAGNGYLEPPCGFGHQCWCLPMSPPAWFALFLLLWAGLVVSALLICRVIARRRARYALSTANRSTARAPSPVLSTNSSRQEPVAKNAPALSEDDPPQPNAFAPSLDSTNLCAPSDHKSTAESNETACLAAADNSPETNGLQPSDDRPFGHAAIADPRPLIAAEPDSREDNSAEFTLVNDQDAMRITKRSSGGRGEYEISEAFGRMTPRDLLNRVLVLDLGQGLRIPSGVLLLDRNGKRRLRIDPASGAEIHLHRQLAAALLMPYPARGETAWGSGEPVMQSDRYGIGNNRLVARGTWSRHGGHCS